MSGIPVFSAGTSLQSSGASVSAQIPADSAGMLPLFVRVTATAAGYFRLSQDGASAAIGDLLIQPSDGLILKTCGLSQFSFVSQSGASTVTVTPIDVGGVVYPAGITPPVNVFSPLSLFAAGEQGVYLDPNNSATLFEDAAGTIPTALERPVGLMLDQSKGLVLGPELVTNGNFGANIDGWSSVNNAVISWKSEKLQISGDGTTAYPYAVQTISGLTIGKSYRFYGVANKVSGADSQALVQIGAAVSGTAIVTNGEMTAIWLATTTSVQVRLMLLGATSTYNFDNISVRELPGNLATSSSTARPTLTRRVNQFVNSEALATQSVTTRATTQTLRFEGTGTVTLSGTATGVYTAGTYSVTTTAGTLTATVSGTVTRADLREANFGVNLPAYQRVGDTSVNAADYDATGFPAWLRCSGGQSMVTPSINFTGTDKMTVLVGVRKLSDAAIGAVLEVGNLGTVTNGVSITAPQATATGNYGFQSGGSSLVSVAGATYAAPISNVLAGIGNVSGQNATLRANGVQIATSGASQGTGNYGNYPLYLFARNQASLFFNGLAGPIVVRGAQSSAAEIANAEAWINAQQKVY